MPPARRKGVLLLLFLAAGVILVILAGGMAGVPFDAGRAFARRTPLDGLTLARPTINYDFLFFFYIFLLGAAIVIMVLNPEGRRKALIFLAVIGILGLVFYQFIDRLVLEPPPVPTPALSGEGTAVPVQEEPVPPLIIEDEAPLTTPDWLVTVVGVILALLLAVTAGMIYVMLSQRKDSNTLLQALAEDAKQTAASLYDGEEYRDVILRCYAQMIRRLEEDRHLQRSAAVTPREFEQTLVRLGFPTLAVHNLTSLFEAVRYGHILAGPKETQQAVECLEAIASHIQNLGEI